MPAIIRLVGADCRDEIAHGEGNGGVARLVKGRCALQVAFENVCEIVRDRPFGLHARHQDARADHGFGAGSRRAGAVPLARRDEIDCVRRDVFTELRISRL